MLELDDFWGELMVPGASLEEDSGTTPKPGDIWERNDQGESVRIVRVRDRDNTVMTVPTDGGRLQDHDLTFFTKKYRKAPKRRDALNTHVDPNGHPIAGSKWRDANGDTARLVPW